MTSEAPDDEDVREELETARTQDGSDDGGSHDEEDDVTDGDEFDETEEPYEVFVQWARGEPHEYAESVNAPDPEMALLLAKRNVDVRSEPLSIWVAPRRAFSATRPEDTTLAPKTDREYRNVAYYAQKLRGEVE